MTTPSGGWNAEQLANANTIIQVGNQLGASQRDITIALMTAMQESNLININYGDAAGPDSLGLFQQRAPWGSAQARMDPAESARMFFEGGSTGEPGLFSFSNRNSMSLTQAAQAVQVSAFPTAYAKWQGAAQSLLGTTSSNPVEGPANPSTNLAQVSGSALSQAGLASVSTDDQMQDTTDQAKPDILKGEDTTSGNQQSVLQSSGNSVLDAEGSVAGSEKSVTNSVNPLGSPADMQSAADSQFLKPMTLTDFTSQMGGQTLPGSTLNAVPAATGATGARGTILQKALAQVGTPYQWGGQAPGGFDCSGLVQWAYAQAGIQLPRISFQQAQSGPKVAINQLQPGDLVGFDEYNRNGQGLADHIAIYLGNNQILEAPHTGADVRVRTLGPADEADAWGVSMASYFGGGASGSSQAGGQ